MTKQCDIVKLDIILYIIGGIYRTLSNNCQRIVLILGHDLLLSCIVDSRYYGQLLDLLKVTGTMR